MIKTLTKIISETIQDTVPLDDWRLVKKAYFWYSYLAFFSISMCLLDDIEGEVDEKKLMDDGCKKGLIEKPIADYLLTLSNCAKVVNAITTKRHKEINLSILYQEYISLDFSVDNGRFVFDNGKFSRDILGAYYTSEEFAYEITRKAIDDYIFENLNISRYSYTGNYSDAVKKKLIGISFLDSACGSGEFLLAVIRYCKNNLEFDETFSERLVNNIYGFDVDPLALLITKTRVILELSCKLSDKTIILGNPLIQANTEKNILQKFNMAAEGRFYNDTLGMNISNTKFSIILGNPPWEKIRFEEKKFFMHYVQDLSALNKKTDRVKVISEKLSEKNDNYYNDFKGDYVKFKKDVKKSKYLKYSLHGELNTYALFTEMNSFLLEDSGIAAIIVKSSLLKTSVCSPIFRYLLENRIISEAYLFNNKKKIFAIDSREEFSVVFLNGMRKKIFKIALDLDDYKKMGTIDKYELTSEFLEKINPLTNMVPNVKSKEEMDFLTNIYSKHRFFGDIYDNCSYGRLVHLTNHSNYISKEKLEGYIQIYEGKFIEQYTGKYSSFSGMNNKDKYKGKATAKCIINQEGDEYPEARFFVEKEFWNKLSKNFNEDYTIMWRSLTSATNRRTMLATILPSMPTCQSLQLLQVSGKEKSLQILALFNSVIFDYIVRLKMAGLDLTQTIIKQIPVPEQNAYDEIVNFQGVKSTLGKHIYSRLSILYQNDVRLKTFFDDMDLYAYMENENRKKIIAEIDVLISKAYKIEHEELRNIVGLFDKYYSKREAEMWF